MTEKSTKVNESQIDFLGLSAEEGLPCTRVDCERLREMGMTELKPCPFCDSTEIYTYEPTAYEIGNDASVECENPICGAEVRGRTLKEAIAKWNRRVKE